MATDPSQECAPESSLVEVALSVPLPIFFTYRVPPGMSAPAGVRVRVPFGTRRLIGVVFGPGRPESVVGHKLRSIDAVLDPEPIIDAQALTLARWLADYWFAPPGEAVSLLLPPRMAEGEDAPTLRSTLYVRLVPTPPAPTPSPDDVAPPSEPKQKSRQNKPRQLSEKMAAALEWLTRNGDASADTLRSATGITLDTLRRLADRDLIVLDSETRFRDPLAGVSLAGLRTPGGTHPLTPAQRLAADTVAASFGTYKGFLLHGVTGSGKTEVYLDLIERALANGMGSIVLVPEIALTPQLVSRFRARLGERVAVQHSGLDPLARHEQWLRIRSGELPVVVGARSALFAPLPNLGLVVVDEEHEPSFKQETSPRYHARDLALVRGNIASCPVVLGSATPSLESWTNVKRHKLTRLSLPERAHLSRPLPEVELVDMRPERDRSATPAALAPTSTAATHTGPSPDPLFSSQLLSAIESNLASGDQTLLFLNRRGYSSFIQCKTCGSTLDCRSCSVTYTWHRQRQRLVCHYCDESRPFPPACPRCNRKDLADLGHGTEQVEERLQQLFPDAAIARMDKDTTRGTALVKLLSRFRKGDIDVLIGTQMVAKGHDFPRVTLVGVLAAEHGLAFPDFRASERTFQLLTQIAGRAGRAERPGRVIVQTRMPDHYAIARAVHHDVEGFLDLETELRAARGFPPTTHLALFRVSGRDLDETEATARRLVGHLREHLVGTASVTDAQPAPIERVKDRFRFQVLLRAHERRDLRRVLDQTREHWSARLPSHLQIALDVDPLAFL